jgi:hypothetical protein
MAVRSQAYLRGEKARASERACVGVLGEEGVVGFERGRD